MKLEPNMYVRTKYGIAKILYATDEYLECDNTIMRSFGENYYSWDIPRLNIVKSSHNITDLIEIGDYVNGYKVEKVNQYEVELELVGCFSGEFYSETLQANDIKSIVTKEMFSSVEYRVETN